MFYRFFLCIMTTYIDFYNTQQKLLFTYVVNNTDKVLFFADTWGKCNYDHNHTDYDNEIRLYFQGTTEMARQCARYLLGKGYISRHGKDELSGTKKADSEADDFLFEIKIIKTSLSNSSELQTATGALSGFLRAAEVATYTPATPTPRGLGAKIDDISETIKIFEKKITDWSKKPIENEYALLLFILCHLPHETSKNKSYYVVEENGNYRIRFSGHNALAKYLSRNEKYKVGITFQSKDDPITFRPQYDVFYKEFVYYREYLASDVLRDILQGIVDVMKGGYYNAPCDLPLYSPSEQRYKQHFDMQKDNKQHAKNLQGLGGDKQLTEDDPNYFDAEELKRRLAEDNGETGEMLLDKARVMIHGTGVKGFSEALADRYNEGEKFDWTKAKKMAEPFGISSEQELMQACELAVVITARQIAHNGQSIAQRFAALKDLYEQQVSIRPLDTQSRILQQYSTPCPLAFLLGEFVLPRNYNGEWGYFLEPSAGNGMLTVALPANRTVVNEIDNIRRDNLKLQDFHKVCNQDASVERPHKDVFIGIITNPPFGKLKDKDRIERNGWAINALDYKMAVLALDSMDNNGKAAIIVGGKMWNSYWKPLSERSEKKVLFGQWKIFLGYLYAQYNVVDVIYINGDNIYRKQGTQYPIVAILINGRHEYNEANKPNYVFDPERDVIIDTYDQLFDRMIKHLQPTEADADELDASKIHFNPNDDSDISADTQNIIDMAMSYEHKPKYKVGDHLKIRLENGGHDFYVSEIHYYRSDGIPSYAGWDRLTRPALWYEADETMIKGLYDDTPTPTPTDNDRRRRIAKAKAKALNLYIFAQKAQDKDKELIHNLLRGKIGGVSGIDEYKTFIQNALSSNNRDRIECTELISEHSKRIVNYLLNKNIAKYYIKSTDIRHSKNKHGKQTEYSYGQIPITDADLLKIPEILSSPTNIDLPTANPRNGQGIRFIKEYPDGKIYCVMVDEYETEELSVKTSYKKPPLQGNDAIIDPELNVRNARALPMLVAKVTNFFRIQ